METYKVHEDDFFKASLTVHDEDGLVRFVHCEYKKHPTKTNIINARKVFKNIVNDLESEGVFCLFGYTPDSRYAALIDPNFKVLQTDEVNGREVELIVWDLKPQH